MFIYWKHSKATLRNNKYAKSYATGLCLRYWFMFTVTGPWFMFVEKKLNQGHVFVPFKHVPVCKEKRKICNQKHVSGSSRKRIVYNKVEYGCFHSFFR